MKPVSIILAWRDDGGLTVRSDDMPGLILSGREPDKVMAAVLPAIRALRQHAVEKAAERVCEFDWSDNDGDAAGAIEALREALRG